jgi:hypothetical protein
MNRLGFIILVTLALTALYYLSVTMFKPSQPQVVVVKSSGAQNTNQSSTQTPTPVMPGGLYACTKAVYLKVGNVYLCADVVYNVLKTDDSLQVDFQGGVVQGYFTFISAPTCPVTTTPQGILIPCRTQILIPTKQ